VANIQHIADRIFRHADAGRLPAGYALVMGTLVDAYDDDPDFHEWVDGVPGSAVEKLIARMVRQAKWGDFAWLRETVRAELEKGSA
jgi:hypothetical protein